MLLYRYPYLLTFIEKTDLYRNFYYRLFVDDISSCRYYKYVGFAKIYYNSLNPNKHDPFGTLITESNSLVPLARVKP